jgi:hypothetical protein
VQVFAQNITSENAHAIILPVFGEFSKHIQQSTGLGQKILALNQAIKAYQKAQESRIEPLQDKFYSS